MKLKLNKHYGYLAWKMKEWKLGERKERGKYDFPLLWLKWKWEEIIWSVLSSSPEPTIFFSPKWGTKMRKHCIEKKKNYKTTHTFSLFFNNKGIIVIYSLFIHFYIPSTKHTWQQTNVFFYPHNIFYHSTFPSFLPKNLLVKSHHRPNEKYYSIGREFTDQMRNITLLEENPLMVGFLCLPKCD